MARTPAARFVFVTLLLDILGIGIVIPVLPEIVADLIGGDQSAAARWYGPLVALYAVMQVLFSPLLGALSDRYGRRPVIIVSLVGMSASYLVLAWAPTIAWLFVGRAMAGVTGATITTANAYMADVSTPETRARNFGLVGAAFGLGFIMGPALGGMLGTLGPRVPFYGAAAVVLLNALWGLFVLPESLPAERRRALSLREVTPLGGLSNLRSHPLVAGLGLAFFLQSIAQRGLESVWVLYTGHRYGWSELENGLSLAVVGVGAAVVQGALVRTLVPRLGEGRSLVLGLCLSIVAFTLYGLAPEGWMVLLVIPIGSLGAISGPALQSLVTSVVDADRQGAVQGRCRACRASPRCSALWSPPPCSLHRPTGPCPTCRGRHSSCRRCSWRWLWGRPRVPSAPTCWVIDRPRCERGPSSLHCQVRNAGSAHADTHPDRPGGLRLARPLRAARCAGADHVGPRRHGHRRRRRDRHTDRQHRRHGCALRRAAPVGGHQRGAVRWLHDPGADHGALGGRLRLAGVARPAPELLLRVEQRHRCGALRRPRHGRTDGRHPRVAPG
jgi:DHA1 family tetracycline resistance protein-like MFS transporter